jgi:PAS domain S-box-containing protein
VVEGIAPESDRTEAPWTGAATVELGERLRQPESVLEYIIERVPHSIFWKDREGHFLGGNQNLLRDVGLSSLHQLLGKTDADLGFPPEQVEHFRKCDLDVMSSGHPLLDIEEFQDQADGTHTLLTSKVPLRDAAGQVIGMLGIYVDITERKRMEEQLRQARDAALAASRAKGEFLTVMSHELRTPLTLILGPLDYLLTRPCPPLPSDVRDDLQRMRRNASRLLTLVNDILDFVVIEAGQMHFDLESVDVVELVSQLVADAKPAALRAGIDLGFSADGELGRVALDRRKFEKITLNLVGNALKFTPPQGRVLVELHVDPGGGPSLPGAHFELSVSDTGPGIPKEKQHLLFQRFQQIDSSTTRKHEGTGIGLALVKDLAHMHGGSVGLESEPGKGSRFFVKIPRKVDGIARSSEAPVRSPPPGAAVGAEVAAPALATRPRPPAEWLGPDEESLQPGAEGERPRVLVAEDNPDMRRYLGKILGAEYRVEAVTDGRRALEAARARPPAVIVSDVMMPEVDGLELLAQLKRDSELRHIPVLLLTAKASADELVGGLDRGADDYLAKPFSPEELCARVRAARRLHDAYRALDEKHRELQAAHAELRRTQEELVHAAKISAVGTLVAGLSHELNNPLGVILMNAQSTLTSTDVAFQRRSLELIVRHTKRCAQLVARLLDFSHKKPAERQPLCVGSMIERVVDLASIRARRGDVELRIDTAGVRAADDLHIPVCIQEIETALLNLVTNALDATPRGGSVVLSANSRERDERPGLELEVRDTGRGIPLEVLPHVFDPFFTTKSVGQGTGLGLAITRRVVENHSGRVDLESGNDGTVVRLWLPAGQAASASSAPEAR